MRDVRRAFLGCAVALAFACAVSHEPRFVSVPEPGLKPVSRMEQIFDYRTAAVTVASVSEHVLGFPQFPVTFRFYPHRDAFERALLESGYDAALARSTAKMMTAVGGHRGVLLDGSKLDVLPWPERVALLAHEMGHSLQYELGGGWRGTSDQWLREGFAEWLAVRVLQRLEHVRMDGVRRARRSDLRAAGRSRVPPLAELVTFPQWVQAGERYGGGIYTMSFLAVDFLIERHGVPAVLDYFKRFAASQDRMANFRAVFGEDLHGFEAALLAALWS